MEGTFRDNARDEMPLSSDEKQALPFVFRTAFPVNKNAVCLCACIRMCTCSIILSVGGGCVSEETDQFISLSC